MFYVFWEVIVYEGSGSDIGIVSYWYVYLFGDIFGGLFGVGLCLSYFKEYLYLNCEEFYDFYEDGLLVILMCYMLVVVKV